MFSSSSFKAMLRETDHWVDREEPERQRRDPRPPRLGQRTPAPARRGNGVAPPAADGVEVSHDFGCDGSVAQDVVYVVALDDTIPPDPTWSRLHRWVDDAVKTLQPRPVKVHCELFIPPTENEQCCHFSTYLGADGADFTSAWRDEANFRYYIDGPQTGHWHAVPVYGGRGFARSVRALASTARHTPYSVGRYFCSGPPLRVFSSALPDGMHAPAHCATLCARILSRCLPQTNALLHPSAWYGPSTLFEELAAPARMAAQAETWSGATRGTTFDQTQALATLLRGRAVDCCALNDAQCSGATAALTHQLMAERRSGNDTSSLQRELAVALFRWSQVVRKPERR
jgi:hypothetical protein